MHVRQLHEELIHLVIVEGICEVCAPSFVCVSSAHY
jgi:hypothetical protein